MCPRLVAAWEIICIVLKYLKHPASEGSKNVRAEEANTLVTVQLV